MTDQFKDGFLEHLLSNLTKSDKSSSSYKSCIKINGDRHWLKINCIHWTETSPRKKDLYAYISLKKYNTYEWLYRDDKSGNIEKYDEFGHDIGVDKITTTEELNNIITTFTHNRIIKNPWMIYSKEECTICKEDKDYDEFEELQTCSHSFCMSCLDALVKLPHHQHKCPMCRKRFKRTDEEGNIQDDETDEE
jgi:hypothetical protein